MKTRTKRLLAATLCAVAMTVLSITPAYAAENTTDIYNPSTPENTLEITDWTKLAAANVNTKANIRQDSTTESPILDGLHRGEAIQVTGEKDGWTEVITGDTEGYIRSDLLVFGEEAKRLYENTQAAKAQPISASNEEQNLLAAIIQCEAGGESYEGKIAVGAVIMNRIRSTQFPNTISEVVYQSGQFSPVSSGILASTLSQGARQDCLDAAKDVLNGANNIGDCLYFNSGYGQGIQIGNQHFY
ncbi:MAG: cell wall hydrolase [Blautia sp.]|jgi:N-acetylmuramoyl-L-alanine amidase